MRYYNFETMWRSLKDLLCKYLESKCIYYELSGAAAGWHFEILTDTTGAQMINNYIDSITISEVR